MYVLTSIERIYLFKDNRGDRCVGVDFSSGSGSAFPREIFHEAVKDLKKLKGQPVIVETTNGGITGICISTGMDSWGILPRGVYADLQLIIKKKPCSGILRTFNIIDWGQAK
jgi:hypothetical protein